MIVIAYKIHALVRLYVDIYTAIAKALILMRVYNTVTILNGKLDLSKETSQI